ncbi:hydroxymethylglutaryl-CoA reductase [Candidatus Halobonum tyrrellensis]|uniref:hydroxymethylglutaryl-CoA reductase (NADPH) n=1 Tax=Candidatus Halobonum tyrrellensis G22 TaxID=1324957 RepID=V4HIU8_9EURY|nr:hydroxymethylglutaryl-CoA reductase [Candidatus Halobonum tyrrellensis]ESP87824.1 3-hydroxy-3-methylglutaryl-CoA reductase [Candidatus Halobonum tyrrellensis G22]
MSDADTERLAARVREGDLRLYELEEHADADTAVAARRLLVEEASGAELETTGEYAFPAEMATGTNVENMVGAVQVPVGVVGPVTIDGGALSGERHVPMATTEGALLASVNRGCSALNTAGGASARVLKNRMTRAPVFRVDGVVEAEALASWTRDNVEALRAVAEATTNHGELREVRPYAVGNNVYLRFAYDTKDAMGMNMATIATEAACEVVEDETGAELVALSGNLCSDKKPAAVNAVEGRGRTVAADVTVPRETVRETLKTTPEAVAEVNTRKNLVGSAKAGSLGFNAHVANAVAAVFLATGQDAAQVVEGANAITTAEVVAGDAPSRTVDRNGAAESGVGPDGDAPDGDAPDGDGAAAGRGGDLYVSVTLASLEVGTVGGGTKLPTQAEALDVLGVRGGGDPAGSNADALAEAVAVTALAGELSLLSALASRNLSSAHAELGR